MKAETISRIGGRGETGLRGGRQQIGNQNEPIYRSLSGKEKQKLLAHGVWETSSIGGR